MTPRERLTPKEIQVATLVWEGLTNREIGNLMDTTEQVVKNHLAKYLRQTRRLESARVGNVRSRPGR